MLVAARRIRICSLTWFSVFVSRFRAFSRRKTKEGERERIMADPFVAEIRIFPFNFPPKGWAHCNGQLMPISQNTALFSLLGTYYGGDGKSTFALPDMQGNTPVHPGQGQGLSERYLGEMSGVESVTLLVSEIPLHTHTMRAVSAEIADINTPGPQTSLAYSNNG